MGTEDTVDVSVHTVDVTAVHTLHVETASRHVSASTLAAAASTPDQPQLAAAGGSSTSRSRKKRVRVGETRESSEAASRESSRRSSNDASLGACLPSCHRATSARQMGLWSVHIMQAMSRATQALEAQLEPCAS